MFSLAAVACAVAPTEWVFALPRLVAGLGLGLGGLVPSANALAADFIPPRRRAAMATLMMSGVPIGGSPATLLPVITRSTRTARAARSAS